MFLHSRAIYIFSNFQEAEDHSKSIAIYDCSIAQHRRMLEASLGTDILAQCLNDPVNATQMVLSNEVILKKDFSNLLSSANGFACLAAKIASNISWRWLWDIALEKGVTGTCLLQCLLILERYVVQHHVSCASLVDQLQPYA